MSVYSHHGAYTDVPTPGWSEWILLITTERKEHGRAKGPIRFFKMNNYDIQSLN